MSIFTQGQRRGWAPVMVPLVTAMMPLPALAEAVLEEIVVTARKKSENLQDVPISVYAKTGASLQKSGIGESLAIDELVPNLEIKTFGGQPNIFIRGVGNNDFNATTISPVSMYQDGVLLGLTGSQSMPMYDVDRIEVLRGPQGTLFGRNTTGGALVFHSTQPGDEMAGHARIRVGDNDRLDAEFGVSIPLTEATAVRLSGASFQHDGDRYNVTQGRDVNGSEMRGARAILVSDVTDALTLTANIHWAEDRSDYRQGRQAPDGPDVLGYTHPTPNNKEKLYLDGPNRHYADQLGASVTLEWSNESYTVKSISAVEDAETDYCGDIDQSPNSLDHLCFATDGEQFSQEFNLSFSTESGMDWLLGAYYLREKIEHSTEGPLFGDTPFALPVDGLSHRITDTMAVFAEVTYALADRWSLNVGLRYTFEEKEADVESAINLSILDPSLPNEAAAYLVPKRNLEEDWDAMSGRIALSYDLTDDVMLYASLSSGFKSGGFNLGSFFDPNEVTTVDPEFLTAYELGVKSTFWQQRGRLNLSGFYYDYSDLQVYIYTAGSSPANPVVFALENAADAEIYGLEAELELVPVDGLSLQAGLGWLRTEYKNFVSAIGGDLSGNQLPGAPKLNANLAVEYKHSLTDALSLSLRGEYSYTDHRYFSVFEDDAISSRGSHSLINGRLSIGAVDQSWEVALWGKNLADKDYIVDATDLRGTFGIVPLYLGDLRSYGIEVSTRF